mgnify:FL=1
MPAYYLFPDETLVLRFQIKDENNSVYSPSEANINLSYQSDCGIGKFDEDTENKYVYFFFKPNISNRETGYIALHLNGTIQLGDEKVVFHDTEKIYLLFKNIS